MEAHHPSHILFAFALREALKEKESTFFLVAQARQEVVALLKALKMNATLYPARSHGVVPALASLHQGWQAVSQAIATVHPERILSIAGTYTAYPAWRAGIPNALLTDTETATLSHCLAYPFADTVYHPRAYNLKKDRARLLSKGKRSFYAGHQESVYLHCSAFRKRIACKVTDLHPIIFIRAIAWQAYHERGSQKGWATLLHLVQEKRLGNIVASVEGSNRWLRPFTFSRDPLLYHAYLSQASLVITEGATTATEATYYNVPVLYINQNLYGTVAEGVKKGRIVYASSLLEGADKIARLDLPSWQRKLKEQGPRRGTNLLNLWLGHAGE